MINFGGPRLGDPAFAQWAEQVFPSAWRVVHHQDIVPHSPSMIEGYHHTSTEMYEAVAGQGVRQCDGSGEDPTCSQQWHSWQTSTADHVVYLGMCLH